MSGLSIAVCGAGVIGQAHIRLIQALPARRGWLKGIIDPMPQAQAQAEMLGVRYSEHLVRALDEWRPDAVIIASPNALHVEMAGACIARNIPLLVEKPLADNVADAFALAHLAEERDVPLLVGHFRRHNPVMRAARDLLAKGGLGRLVSVNADVTVCKPDAYFNVPWRTQSGGGPVLINLVHDIDALRYLCGEIESVQAVTSNAARGFEVEDTAAVLLRFTSGALATLTLSDATPSPWCWDQTSGENKDFARHQGQCYRLCGTEAALELPGLIRWHYAGQKGWTQPLSAQPLAYEPGDPLALQLDHFLRVARREEQPMVSGKDGAATLAATMAVLEAARTGRTVTPARNCQPA
ncbi:Gfo/Idh/MocA family protein [Acidocella aminolytica]|uniref:Oxidoreductase NAD-binding subunit n=1 Tax=Acidocella aminolytica 101 = DSM 11237 TaxID=1120923 RepID=A0A0D6PEE6_9PROT|nr:Gfo/Idh/MocA family oxidoreductase [Acidocella aminolytica]GAN79588.1 oxidoreductase NAD-binding subunit [Acidocella aminolytica 101 = DSM 11237]GBQ39067.1 putative dehydrogenase [Acidocella aminolytica 101 = DSM 11237]SHF27556.1 Predicted dehydrogenase [Acidocella aminolytica 101 = DSM 11237]